MARQPEFQIFGIPVRIDPSFFLMAVFLGWTGMRGPALLVVWVVVVLVSVLWHELGHALAIRAFGFQPRIDLYAMGGLTSSRRPPRPGADILISLAGPGAGLLLGGLVLAVARARPFPPGSGWDLAMQDMVWVNVGWGLLNLIPILPLDGGQVMASVLSIVTRGREARPALMLSLAFGAAGAAWAVSQGFWWGAILLAYFGANNLSALSRLRPPRSPAEIEGDLAEGEEALARSDLRAAERKARDVLGAAEDPGVREAAARLLLWAALFQRRWEAAGQAMPALAEGSSEPLLSPAALGAAGGVDEALAALRQAFEARPTDEAGLLLARALVEAGRLDEAVALVAEGDGRVGAGASVLVGVAAARARARQGRSEEAVAWLGRAVDAGYRDLAQLERDPDLEAARTSPGFEDLRRRLLSPEPLGDAGGPSRPEPDGSASAAAAAAAGEAPPQPAPWWRRSPGVAGLLALLVVAFAAQQLAPRLVFSGSLIPPAVAAGQWHRLLTATLLHFGVVHLAFNCYALWWIGEPVERAVGTARLVGAFAVSGLVASAASFAFRADCYSQSAGASGAVFGLLGVLCVLSWRSRRSSPHGLQRILISVLVMLSVGFFVPRAIDNLAHLGGLVAGALLGTALPSAGVDGVRRPLVVQLGAALLLAGAAAALVAWKVSGFECRPFS